MPTKRVRRVLSMYDAFGLFGVMASALFTSYLALAAILKGIEMLDPRPV